MFEATHGLIARAGAPPARRRPAHRPSGRACAIPAQYFERPAGGLCATRRHRAPAGRTPLYVVAEKIARARTRTLPRDWAVHGTTGYRFANAA